MFGFFKRKAVSPIAAPATGDRLAAINRQFEEFSEGEIDPVEAALTMFHLDRDKQMPDVLGALQSATIELLISENNPASPPLMLNSARGFPTLAVFTQRKRAERCQETHPEYLYFIRLPFMVALKSIREPAGLVINPYHEVITWEIAPVPLMLMRQALLPEQESRGRPPPLPPQC